MMFNQSYYNTRVIQFGEKLRRYILEKHSSSSLPSFKETIYDLGQLGFLGIRFQTDYLTEPNNLQYHAMLAETMGTYMDLSYAMLVTIHNDMVLPLIYQHNPETLKPIFLSSIRGETILAHAVTEQRTGSDLKSIETTARRVDNGYLVNGLKCYVANGLIANYYCTLLKLDGPLNYPFNMLLLLIPASLPGISIIKQHKTLGHCNVNLVDIQFNNVLVDFSYLLGTEKAGFFTQVRQFQEERVLSSFRATAVANRMLNQTITFCKEKSMSNGLLFDKQVIKHKLAQLKMEISCSYAANHYALHLWQTNNNNFSHYSNLCKLLSNRVVKSVAKNCLHFYGAEGYLEDHLIAKMYKDSCLFSISTGSDEIMIKNLMNGMGDF